MLALVQGSHESLKALKACEFQKKEFKVLEISFKTAMKDSYL